MKSTTSIAIAAALVMGTTAAAFAAKMNDAETAALAQTKISLGQAVLTAEQHVDGKATQASLESSSQGAVYDVEVVTGAKVTDIQIDARSGVVLASNEDQADQGKDAEQDPRD